MASTAYTVTSTPTVVALSTPAILVVQNLGDSPARLSLNEAITNAGSILITKTPYAVPLNGATLTSIALTSTGTTTV